MFIVIGCTAWRRRSQMRIADAAARRRLLRVPSALKMGSAAVPEGSAAVPAAGVAASRAATWVGVGRVLERGTLSGGVTRVRPLSLALSPRGGERGINATPTASM
jgi:hypothetical protein